MRADNGIARRGEEMDPVRVGLDTSVDTGNEFKTFNGSDFSQGRRGNMNGGHEYGKRRG